MEGRTPYKKHQYFHSWFSLKSKFKKEIFFYEIIILQKKCILVSQVMELKKQIRFGAGS